MGIRGLTKLLSDECPDCIKLVQLEQLNGRKIAIDASMVMYQSLIALRSENEGYAAAQLATASGDITSHIQGMFNRTIRLLSSGIKPIYVFDGKPPELKNGELEQRAARRAKAVADHKEALENGILDDIEKFSKRLVRVTQQQSEDCKALLRLMGVPVVEALSEAEAQCAVFARNGAVYAVGTEDMDTLTFRAPKLLRRLSFAPSNKNSIMEIDYDRMISQLGITHEEFVDLCILCGCDYTDSVKGIGPKKGLALIKKHHSIEEILKNIDRTKYSIPADWIQQENFVPDTTASDALHGSIHFENKGAPNGTDVSNDEAKASKGAAGDATEKPLEQESQKSSVIPAPSCQSVPKYVEVRKLFMEPAVHPVENFELKWTDPKEEELLEFLVDKMQFNKERVEAGIKKLKEAKKKGGQMRMDSYFNSITSVKVSGVKRPLSPAKKKAADKKRVGAFASRKK